LSITPATGGESGWAEEQVVTLQDILGWTNQRLPIFVTATCQFGRYDDPALTSGAELALLNPQGGSIALLTTARPVYASTNYLLNNAFYDALAQNTADGAPRLGGFDPADQKRQPQRQPETAILRSWAIRPCNWHFPRPRPF
jgi:hypothetical protein